MDRHRQDRVVAGVAFERRQLERFDQLAAATHRSRSALLRVLIDRELTRTSERVQDRRAEHGGR